jgi:hypothetical protein
MSLVFLVIFEKDTSQYGVIPEVTMDNKRKFSEQKLEERLRKGKRLTREEFIKRIKEAGKQKAKTGRA